MTFTIGRVGDSVALDEMSGWQERSDGTVDLQGWLQGSTVADVEVLRDQLLGLVGSLDEPMVPVTVGHDDTRDGWYRVLDAEVEHDLGATPTSGARRWRATIRRSPWWDQPRLEVRRDGGVVTNVHSITTSTHTGFIGIPTAGVAIDSGTDTGSLTLATRVAETGSMRLITGSGTGAALYNTVVSYDCPLANIYDGAATVEVNVGGGTYRPVIGRPVRREYATAWRLNNGLLRVSWDTTNHGLIVSGYISGAWEANPESFLLTDTDAHNAVGLDPIAWSVLRNDPAMALIRLLFSYNSGASRIIWDVGIRRGDRNCINVVKSRTSAKWGLKLSAGSLATDLVGGIQRNGDDANDNCFTIALPKTTTDDLSTSEVYLTTASQVFPFGIGMEMGGAAATGQNTAQNVIYQYYAQPIETLGVSAV